MSWHDQLNAVGWRILKHVFLWHTLSLSFIINSQSIIHSWRRTIKLVTSIWMIPFSVTIGLGRCTVSMPNRWIPSIIFDPTRWTDPSALGTFHLIQTIECVPSWIAKKMKRYHNIYFIRFPSNCLSELLTAHVCWFFTLQCIPIDERIYLVGRVRTLSLSITYKWSNEDISKGGDSLKSVSDTYQAGVAWPCLILFHIDIGRVNMMDRWSVLNPWHSRQIHQHSRYSHRVADVSIHIHAKKYIDKKNGDTGDMCHSISTYSKYVYRTLLCLPPLRNYFHKQLNEGQDS